MTKKCLSILIASTAALAAQTAAPPKPNPADYAEPLAILNGQAATPPPPSPPAKRTKHKAADIKATISSDAEPFFRELPLSADTKVALALSESAQAAPVGMSVDRRGRLVYVYGRGTPVVVCALLQVCEVDLEPGEVITKDSIEQGDDRFSVVAHTAGAGAREFSYLALKPTVPRLDTTLSVGTNRRTYYLRLISTAQEGHMARVAFSYPEEEAEQREAEEAKRREAEQAKAEADRLAKLNTTKPLRNWNYSVKLHGKDAKYLRPLKIADDGAHTHIELPEEARFRGLPVVQLSDARGPIPANWHWVDVNELVIDAVFAHACLLEGVGRHQQRACITNEGLQADGKH